MDREPELQTSLRMFAVGLLLGSGFAAVAWWFLPGVHWLVYPYLVVVGVFVSVAFFFPDQLKASDRESLSAIVWGTAAALLVFWWVPTLHWGVYIGIGVLVGTSVYTQGIKMAAHKRIADGE